jgi:hypothetical protein
MAGRTSRIRWIQAGSSRHSQGTLQPRRPVQAAQRVVLYTMRAATHM